MLARAKRAGLTTKSGLILGLGETDEEVAGALADLARHRHRHRDARAVPAADHPPHAGGPLGGARGVRRLKRIGEAMGIGHVEASPLTRSSYHAKQAASGAIATMPSGLSFA